MATPIIEAGDKNLRLETTDSSTTLQAAEDWPRICKALTEENGHLHKEMAALREERDRYYRALLALSRPRPEDLQFTKAEALAQTGTDPSWQELMAEIEHY